MGKPSREKGKRGEREVVTLFADHGIRAQREAALQASGIEGAQDVRLLDFPRAHLEVKRQERLDVPAWLRQVEKDAPEDADKIVAFRRSKEPWRAIVDLDFLAELMTSHLAILSVTEGAEELGRLTRG